MDERSRLSAGAALAIAVSLALVPASGSLSLAPDLPHPAPDAPAGFQTRVLATVPTPTAIAFGPGEEQPDLFAATLTGDVFHVDLLWTPAGPVAVGQQVVHEGLESPFGLAFADGELYASAVHEGQVEGREDGVIWQLDGEERTAVVDGLPTGRHQNDHLREGPDGRLHFGLGPADTPPDPDPPNVPPYSGSILSFDPAVVAGDPAVLHWFDADGDRVPEDEMAEHPVNEDFNGKVEVVAHGLETAFGLGFRPDGSLYTPMMGGDDPTTQDVLYRIEPGTDYGFPECHNVGPSGGTGDEVEVEPSPAFPDAHCSDVPSGMALLGWHVGSTGLDAPRSGPASFPPGFADDVYVSEVGPLPMQALEPGPLETGVTPNDTGHKVVRIVLDDDGEALRLDDFLSGLAAPIDVRFGPDGAMYVPDVGASTVLRVAPSTSGAPAPAG